MTSKVLGHFPCPSPTCGSSDALAVYEDGGHCFSCDDENIPKDFWHKLKNRDGKDIREFIEDYMNGVERPAEVPVIPASAQVSSEWRQARVRAIESRGLTDQTAKIYGVRVLNNDVFYPLYDHNNKLVAYKKRTPEKGFVSVGRDKSSAVLFGMNAFSSGGKYLTITEGEFDAMAAYQMMGGKGPVISLANGSNSLKRSLANQHVWEYINSFENIVICFDNDKAGKEAIQVAVDLLDPKKLKIMKLGDGCKDANDYLLKGKSVEFVKTFWSAEEYSPDDIIKPTSDAFREAVLYGEVEKCYPYPFDDFTEKTNGIRKGEMVTVIADTGVGKTQVMREFEHFYATTTMDDDAEFKVGIMHIEERTESSMKGLMSVHLNSRLHLPNNETSFEDKEKAYDALKDRCFFYDSWGSDDVEKILSRVRFLVKVLGCDVVFLDHISMITSDQRQDDERRALDEIATRLKASTVDWNYNLHLVAHVNREGRIRGSGNIKKLSDVLIRLSRDVNADDDMIRNTTKATCEKNRFSGNTGVMGYLLFEDDTGRMTPTIEPEVFNNIEG